ncbi:MAG: hypothetical protein LRY55_13365 [Leadbetterella sp.]|nr:hypothetical protein [Leadbetterella sp.]
MVKKNEILESLKKKETEEFEAALYRDEVSAIDKEIADLYKEASQKYAGTYEITYILPGDPGFTYNKYIGFYNDLPQPVKDSFYGQNFYKALMLKKTPNP